MKNYFLAILLASYISAAGTLSARVFEDQFGRIINAELVSHTGDESENVTIKGALSVAGTTTMADTNMSSTTAGSVVVSNTLSVAGLTTTNTITSSDIVAATLSVQSNTSLNHTVTNSLSVNNAIVKNFRSKYSSYWKIWKWYVSKVTK